MPSRLSARVRLPGSEVCAGPAGRRDRHMLLEMGPGLLGGFVEGGGYAAVGGPDFFGEVGELL